MNLTYRQLATIIQEMDIERLDDNVTVFDTNVGEYFQIAEAERATEGDDQLDVGHLFLRIEM